MGIILSTLSDGGGKREPVDIFLDFEKAEPQGDEEKEVYASVAKVLDMRSDILQKLKDYKGCEEFIRAAITSPSDSTEEAAWGAVLPAVERLKEFYDFSIQLEGVFPSLLVALCRENPRESLKNKQALAKQFAHCFDFVLQFDDLKMLNPAIQNDFSYYRRTLNRMRLSKKTTEISIKDELANRMSLFFAYPTPMMNVINETTAKFLSQNSSVPQENVTTALAIMAAICTEMVSTKKFESDDTNMFCLRCMTGAIILYDQLHPTGAFCKRSEIDIKCCITELKSFSGDSTDGLLNALRFTTVHLQDPDTPSSIKQLLE